MTNGGGENIWMEALMQWVTSQTLDPYAVYRVLDRMAAEETVQIPPP